MQSVSVAYFLINRGRFKEEVISESLNYFDKNPNAILIADESDATDKDKGLDGRLPLLDIAIANPKLKLHTAKDDEIGINLLLSPNFKVESTDYTQINRLNLLFPQGKSEKYKHHRLVTKIAFPAQLRNHFNLDGLIIVAQHNSAFIRPFTRAIQSANAMKAALMLQIRNPHHLVILVRDQNTMIPGEGKMERLLRYIYKMRCITDETNWLYDIAKLETDTGGLNKFAGWLNKKGAFKFLRNFIAISDKIESMCIVRGFDKKFGIVITPKHTTLKNLDHGILSIKIEKIG